MVAAIECNHLGSMSLAKEMIRRAKVAHCDYCKFQYFHVSELGVSDELAEKLKKVALSLDELVELKEYAASQQIGWFATPMKTIKTMRSFVKHVNPTIIKIREADSRNDEFVDAAAATGKIVLISNDPRKGPMLKPSQNSWIMYCFPDDEQNQVLTANGAVTPGKVKPGDFVLTHLGRWRRVLHVFKRRYVGSIRRVKFCGVPEILCTPEHPFLTSFVHSGNHKGYRNRIGQTEWREASLLSHNDFYSGRNGHMGVSPCIPKRIGRTGRPPWRDYLLGLYLAEGSLHSSGIQFVLGSHERPLIERLREWGQYVYDCEPYVKEQGSGTHVVFSRIKLKREFSKFYIGLPHHALQKRLPVEMMPMAPSVIQGLLDGDGWEPNGKTERRYNDKEIALISPSLAWQCFVSLQGLRFQTAINVRNTPQFSLIFGKLHRTHPIYRIRFREGTEGRAATYIESDKGFLRSVRSNTECSFDGFVYNFEVEEDNSYLVNGIAAHNCIPSYPPRTADFNHTLAGSADGFSSHYPHTTFDRISVREARAAGRDIYWLEVHVMMDRNTECLDRNVSIDFEELAEVCAYAHRERDRT